MASWSREAVLSFIEIYKSKECLWRIKSKDYSNRILKDKAYEHLVRFASQFDTTANRDMVTKKINSIRTAFRKELKKCENSKTSGAGEEDVYVPKLWYFNELLFLRDQELPRSSISKFNIEMGVQPLPSSSQQHEEDTERNTQESLCDEDEDVDKIRESGASSYMRPDLPLMSSARASPSAIAGSSSKGSDVGSSTRRSASSRSRPGKRKAEDELLTLVHDRLQIPGDDVHDAFAKTVAFKMRKLSTMQCFIAEKIINDVLFAAGLERLSTQSHFVAQPPQPPQAPVAQFAHYSNHEET